MLQVRRTALLLALLAPLYLGLAGRSTLLGAPLPPGEREVRQRTSCAPSCSVLSCDCDCVRQHVCCDYAVARGSVVLIFC